MSNDMTTLVLVRGLPGSGKTTFAKALAEQYPNAVLAAADDHFTNDDGEYVFDGKLLGEAHSACQAKVRSALEKRTSVIVHNTFTTKREFEAYLRMAKPTIRLAVYNVFDGGLTNEELAERNTHGVPLASIEKMRARWESAPVEERFVYVEGTHAYWLFPEADHVELKLDES